MPRKGNRMALRVEVVDQIGVSPVLPHLAVSGIVRKMRTVLTGSVRIRRFTEVEA